MIRRRYTANMLTWFYKKITQSDEFPEGKDLTPLDLFCLISAIPATVIYKLVKGQPPFPEGDATNAIISATDINSLQTAFGGFQTVSSVQPGLLGHGETDTGKTVLNVVGSIAATIGAVSVDLFLLLKSQLPAEMDEGQTTANRIFSVLQCVGYMGYILPDMISAVQSANQMFDDGNWFIYGNNMCTFIAVVKYVVDASSAWWPASVGDPYGQTISPVLDFCLNVAWEVPTIFQLLHDVQEHGEFVPADSNAIVECIGGTAFDMSGVLSPVYAQAYYFMPPSEVQEGEVLVAVAGISACNLVWAGSCLATTFDGLPVP